MNLGLFVVIGLFALEFTIPRHDRLPAIALGQPNLYRVEIFLALFYGGLLVLTPILYGILQGKLPDEISSRGAKWSQAASAASATIDQLDAAVKDLQGDSTDLRAKLVEQELAATHRKS